MVLAGIAKHLAIVAEYSCGTINVMVITKDSVSLIDLIERIKYV